MKFTELSVFYMRIIGLDSGGKCQFHIQNWMPPSNTQDRKDAFDTFIDYAVHIPQIQALVVYALFR